MRLRSSREPAAFEDFAQVRQLIAVANDLREGYRSQWVISPVLMPRRLSDARTDGYVFLMSAIRVLARMRRSPRNE